MQYGEFLSFITAYQSKKVKPFSLPKSCSPEAIPTDFGFLLEDIIKIMEKYFSEFSDNQPFIGIFGLQPTSIAITTPLPMRINRVLERGFKKGHVCCVLSFLPLSHQDHAKVHWDDAKRLVVDFTRGILMSEQHYLYELFHIGSPGLIYGEFNSLKLQNIWERIMLLEPNKSLH